MKSRLLTSLFVPKSGLLVLLLVLLGAYPATFFSGGHDQPSAPDHQENRSVVNSENNYTVIRTEYQSIVNEQVRLQGVFDDAYVANEISSIRYVSIPASVDGDGVEHQERFQIWHQINDGENIPRNVTYADQFGERTLLIRDADFLVVPADGVVARRAESDRISGQHYKAYITSASGLGQEVVVSDGVSQDNVIVGAPRYFLVPVEKVHDGTTSPIEDASTYLVVYNIAPRFNLTGSGASMSDQFFDGNLDLMQKFFLAVPAKLADWNVVPQ